jgi:hypothetical protein
MTLIKNVKDGRAHCKEERFKKLIGQKDINKFFKAGSNKTN